jgi:hypothetical protein
MKLTDVYQNLRLSSKSFLALVCVLFVGLVFLLVWLFKPVAVTDFKPEIHDLTAAIRVHFQKNIDYQGLDTAYVIEQKLSPKEMIRIGKLFSKSNSEILIGRDMKGNPVAAFEKTFAVTYLNLSKAKCLSLLTSDFSADSGLVSIAVSNDKLYELTYGGELSLPVSQDKALEYCKAKNTVMLIFE